jgi:hypothetical protein
MTATLDPQSYDLPWLVPGATLYQITYTRYSTGARRINKVTVVRLTKTLAILNTEDGRELRVNRTRKGQTDTWDYLSSPDPVLVEHSPHSWSSSWFYIVPEGHVRLERAKTEAVDAQVQRRLNDAVTLLHAQRSNWNVETVTELRAAADAWLAHRTEQ